MAQDHPATPLRVENADSLKWDAEADLVVVGFGGAGAAAAVEASSHGASVIAVDRFEGGGSTAFSGGVMYAGGTRYQKESGFDDSVEEMYKYLLAEGCAVKPETLRRFCEESSANLDWLEGFGVQHGGNAYPEKTSFPPDGYWIYFSGNEKVPLMVAKARPAPRGHRVVTPGAGGHVRYAKLLEAATARGVKLMRHAPATRLVMDAQGGVIGVEVNALPENLWKRHSKLYSVVNPYQPFNGTRSEKASAAAAALERSASNLKLIRARNGVLLTTGGFIHNRELLKKHNPLVAENFSRVLRLGAMGDDGSGMALGVSAGGRLAHMDRVLAGRSVAPPIVFVQGMLVNAHGKRFVDEGSYLANVGDAILRQPNGGKAWLILTAADFWEGIRKSFRPGKGNFMIWGAPTLLNAAMGGTRRAGSIESLARKIRVDAAGLKSTLAAYDAFAASGAASGEADDLGKSAELIRPLGKGPYYALNLSVDNTFGPMFALSTGGLDVDEDTGAVLGENGAPVPGLYAAGRAAVGVCTTCFASGVVLADVIFSGRRAGRTVAGATQ